MRPYLQLWCFAVFLSYAGAVTQKTELVVSNAFKAPDGFNKRIIVVNGTSPGPVIRANKGDKFQINIRNELSDLELDTTTSIHWHGVVQNRTNPFDGTSFVTQCPIVSGNSFLYEFGIYDQAGTFWYHSHQKLQYCDGLRGPLIIYDPYDPYKDMYDFDDESTILSLFDWYHVNAQDAVIDVNPWATLVNGKGRYPGGPNVTLSVTPVEQGKRYRLRLINMSCKAWITFSIDNHDFTVIEADGHAVLPVKADSITLHAGQRYSVVLEANQPVDNYWIRAMPQNYASNFTNGLNSAILRYNGASDQEPMNRTWALSNLLDETNLHSRDYLSVPGEPYPGGVDVAINLVTSFNLASQDHWVNGIQYHPPDTPTLLQILSGTAGITQLADQGSVYVLPPNKVIEVSWDARNFLATHPVHLHGHSFYVVRSAGSLEYNYGNPVVRDTVATGIGANNDNVTVRFRTDNAGPWIFHCHNDFHLYKGMAVILAEDPQDTAQRDPVNNQWKQLCQAYNQSLANGTETV